MGEQIGEKFADFELIEQYQHKPTFVSPPV